MKKEIANKIIAECKASITSDKFNYECKFADISITTTKVNYISETMILNLMDIARKHHSTVNFLIGVANGKPQIIIF